MKRFALVLTCLLVPGTVVCAQTPEEKKQTVAYVRGLQNADGGFAPAKGAKSSLRATSSALRALKYFGGDVPDRAALDKFLGTCVDKATGVFVDHPGGKPDVTIAAVGILASGELKPGKKFVTVAEQASAEFLLKNATSFDDIRIAAAAFEAIEHRPRQADAWLKQLQAMQNQDGTYGEGDGRARATGGAVACWLRLGGKIDNPDAVLAAMRKGQRPDGGFGREKTDGSDLESSYRVMRAFHMLKAKPDAAKLRGFLAKCRNADGGYGVKPGDPSTVSATYFAGIILKWLE